MKRKIAAVLMIFVCLLAGCGQGSQEEVPELIEPAAVQADTAEAVRADLVTEKIYSGAVQPGSRKICFSADGMISKVTAYNGKEVEAGETIIELSAEEADEQLAELEEELNYILQDGAYTDSVYDLDIQILDTELAKLNSEGADAKTIQAKQLELESKNAEKRQNQEQRAVTTRELEEQISELQESSSGRIITAPVSGNIYLDPAVSAGNTARSGQTAFWITDPSEKVFTVDSYVSANTLAKNSWCICIDGEKYETELVEEDIGTIGLKYAAGQTVTTSFTFAGEQEIPDVGTYGYLSVESMHLTDVIQVPVDAVLHDEDGYYVYVYEEGARVRRDVTTGRNNGINYEIKEGLAEGEYVYVQENN